MKQKKTLLVQVLAISMMLFSFVMPVHAQGNTNEITPLDPNLQIPIPGLSNFEGSIIRGDASEDDNCASGFVCVNTIGVYLNAVYRYSAGAATLFAIVLLMVGGMQYMLGSAGGTIEQAKERMRNAVIGLTLVLGVTAILTFINPAITSLSTLNIQVVNNMDFDRNHRTYGGVGVFSDVLDGNLRDIRAMPDSNGNRIAHFREVSGPGNGIHTDIAIDLQAAAVEFREATGHDLWLQTGYNGHKKQMEGFFADCIHAPVNPERCAVTPYCNPLPRDASLSPLELLGTTPEQGYRLKSEYVQQFPTESEQITFLNEQALANRNNQACPHLTGYAVDVWPSPYNMNHIADYVPHQLILEEAMRSNAFCRSLEDPWHYEYRGKTIPGTSTDQCSWTTGVMRRCEQTGPNTFNCSDPFDYSECAVGADLLNGRCVVTADGRKQLIRDCQGYNPLNVVNCGTWLTSWFGDTTDTE